MTNSTQKTGIQMWRGMFVPDVYSQRAVMASVSPSSTGRLGPWGSLRLVRSGMRYWSAAGAATATSYRLRRPAIIAVRVGTARRPPQLAASLIPEPAYRHLNEKRPLRGWLGPLTLPVGALGARTGSTKRDSWYLSSVPTACHYFLVEVPLNAAFHPRKSPAKGGGHAR